MSRASVIVHPTHEPTQLRAAQVHHLDGPPSINLTLEVTLDVNATVSMTVAGPAGVLRALLAAQLAVLDQADPARGDRRDVERPFTPPHPAADLGVGS